MRNVEDLLHERGVDICHESVRLWVDRFGPVFAGKIHTKRASFMRQQTQWQWHLDEAPTGLSPPSSDPRDQMIAIATSFEIVKINGVQHYLWRAVSHEGEVLESYVTKTRDRQAALTFLKKAMKRYGNPQVIITDRLQSYGAAMKEIGNVDRQEVGRHLNNRAENSHLLFRRRERAMSRFRRMSNLQKFASTHASFHNHFNLDRHLNCRHRFKTQRDVALLEWRELLAN